MTIFFNQRYKKLLFESKVKVTLFSSKKVDKSCLIKREMNKEVKLCFDSVLNFIYLRNAMTM